MENIIDFLNERNYIEQITHEKELKEALKRFEITKEEYEMAYEEANKLMMLLKEKKEKLNIFTNKYLNYFEKLDLR